MLGIAQYSVRAWGESQAASYLLEIETCCRQLAAKPALGRSCDSIRPGLRRMEQGRHVTFYRERTGGILVVRILHAGMLPGPRLAGGE